jgi:hypothetical protein
MRWVWRLRQDKSWNVGAGEGGPKGMPQVGQLQCRMHEWPDRSQVLTSFLITSLLDKGRSEPCQVICCGVAFPRNILPCGEREVKKTGLASLH